MEYELFVNNVSHGSILTSDIDQFIKDNYTQFESLRYRVEHEEKEVFLFVDIIDLMRQSVTN